jgi:hypothetical protein
MGTAPAKIHIKNKPRGKRPTEEDFMEVPLVGAETVVPSGLQLDGDSLGPDTPELVSIGTAVNATIELADETEKG